MIFRPTRRIKPLWVRISLWVFMDSPVEVSLAGLFSMTGLMRVVNGPSGLKRTYQTLRITLASLGIW